MVTTYYLTIFIFITLVSLVFFWKWNKHVDIYFTLMYCLFPIAASGYYMLSISKDIGSAISAQKFIYLGGCFLSLLGMHLIFQLARIRIPRWIAFISFALPFVVYLSVLTIGYNGLYYKSQTMAKRYGATILVKEYGPMHYLFYPMILFYFLLSLVALIYAFKKKPEASRRNLLLLFITLAYSVFAFFIARMITDAVEFVPTAYLADALIYLFIVDRISLYKISDTVSEVLVRDGESGYISVDLKGRYLACTPRAIRLFPALKDERADLEFSDTVLKNAFNGWIADFKEDEVSHDIYMDYNTRIYRIRVKYLYEGKRRMCYQIKIDDDTDHRQYLKTLEDYNKNIKEELALKTEMLEKKG